MQQLIVNADDYGDSLSVNSGIRYAHEKGVVTSTSLLANGKHFEDAITKLPSTLGLGIHLNLSYGKALSRNKVLDKHFQYKILLKKVSPSFIEKELRAQIEKVKERGLHIDHVNSHQHVHAFSPVKEIVLKLAQEYKIPAIRWQKERAKRIEFNKRYLKNVLISHSLGKCPMKTTDHYFGTIHTGNPQLKHYFSYLTFSGTAEICCHPAEKSLQRRDKFSLSRAKELKVLCHPKLKEAIEKKKIQLIRFQDL